MTQEEKAKAYDEAIERANSLLSSNELGNAWIYKVLPELEEGENEKIRKWLIKQLKQGLATAPKDVNHNDAEKAIAWLEKQGEQKLAWSEEDEEMYEEVLTDIIYAKNDLKTKGCLELSKRAMKAFNWFNKRYKSLRPQSQWKPSDEQFKVLNEVLNFAVNHESPRWNDYIFGTLNNLIRQLKKLRKG